MFTEKNRFKNTQKQDAFISFAVMIQSLLLVLQIFMIDVLHIASESTTIYRVLLTAIPMSVAIILSFIRKPVRFIVCYAVTLLILLFNGLVFPANASYMWSDAMCFLLPVVLPSALCLTCVTNVKVVWHTLYKISWATFCLAVFYVLNIFGGNYTFSGYNMGFSYALLLPAMSLYSRNSIISKLASIVLFILIVVLGSRGAAVIYVMFVIYDLVTRHKKLLVPAALIVMLVVLLIPVFMDALNDLGISSRTLTMLLSGDFRSDSGRGYLYNEVLDAFWEQPILGLGLWGDRPIIGIYCHNIILEMYINWGMIGATIILLILFFTVIVLFIASLKENRMILVMFLLSGIAPLMVSGSYLTDYYFASFIGILYLISKENSKNIATSSDYY